MIYVDMDGVLVNFEKGVKDRTGIDITTKEFDDLGQAKRNKIYSEACDTVDFWIGLDPMPDYAELWGYVKFWKPHILTAYPQWSVGGIDVAVKGKMVWNKAHMMVPENRFHCVKRRDKQIFVETYVDVLIDDKEKNIQEWIAAGGTGVLHTSAEDTIKKLKGLGYTK